MIFLDAQRQIRYANRAAQALLGSATATTSESFAAALARSRLVADASQPLRYQRSGEPPLILDTTEVVIPGDRRGLRIVVLHDVTANEQQALELRAQNEEQRRLLDLVDVLETSVVSIAEDVLFAPIVGYLDSRRAQTFTARLLQEAHQRRTRLVILDITGLPVVDTAAAQALIHTAAALQLLGCQVVLSGISAATATTLVDQQADFSAITTVRTPQEALLAYASAGRNS